MTEKLKALMDERASSLDFPVPDLDTIRAGGTRRRRLQYAGAGAGVAACIAGLTALVLAVGGPGSSGGAQPPVADDAAPTESVARPFDLVHASGSTIHPVDGDAIEVGHQVVSLVSTGVGYVVADPDGVVWSVKGEAVTRLGQSDPGSSELAYDRTSARVGWVDPSGDEPVYVVADQASGEVVTLDVGVPTLRGDDGMTFYALDRGVAYVRGAEGAVAVDVDSGAQQVVDPGAGSFDVLGANDGVVAFAARGELDTGAVFLGPTSGEVTATIAAGYGSEVYFSPEGGHLIVEGDVLAVYDTTTGDAVDFGLPEFSVGIGWLDESTLLAFRLDDEQQTMQLLECSVESVTCEVVDPDLVDLRTVDRGEYVFASGSDFSPDRD